MAVKELLHETLGEATYVLGIHIYLDRYKRLLGLSQSMYIDSIIKRFEMENSKKGFIPMKHRVHIFKKCLLKTLEDREFMDKIFYILTIGSIMYAILCTRLNVTFALSVTSRFQADSGKRH